ncbi:MAG: hypothetical protein AB8G05_01785 [Oligoflexales bacterium]
MKRILFLVAMMVPFTAYSFDGIDPIDYPRDGSDTVVVVKEADSGNPSFFVTEATENEIMNDQVDVESLGANNEIIVTDDLDELGSQSSWGWIFGRSYRRSRFYYSRRRTCYSYRYYRSYRPSYSHYRYHYYR